MLENFKSHLQQKLPFLLESKVIIAISGGIDSVVLAHLCKKLNLDFSLAHCNFNLRDEESDADEVFVLDLAEDLDVEVFVQNFDTEAYAKDFKRSIQMAARELRYNWFAELAEQLKFDYILTAHHADDNLETFLINFTRGTGLNGLTGIPMKNENIVRPLLPFSRQEIEAYAKENQIKWREDSSNSSRKYLRNKLRHEVVPILKDINPQLLDSFQNTLDHLNDTADIVAESVDSVANEAIVSLDEDDVFFKVSEFKNLKNPKAYLFELLNEFGFTEWNDVVNLLDAQSGKQVFSSTHRLVKHRDYLILSEKKSKTTKSVTLSEAEVINSKVKIPLGILFFDEADAVKEKSNTTIYVDKDKLNFPLELRIWKEGDVFHPLGMNGKKKVSKYLKDEKLSLIEKEKTWVLTSNNDIVWIVGKRADERFKVTNKTEQILKVELANP
ncbi:tRNA lysidine(34) synthetase TilS [Winogradskyella ouciana]|uniref:tRNA(Ile)-lysidine synthase n=1 Tax=Winogradskyella ouciana TaxID=2608631 RepID=A0A7K1GBV8_9FLAO|nr:tRNA lysidine(34) synthetase TilS [Winogradskyella ouciana]MTE25409.1 tRNA lysidine(34) synthetase TilS [Winogradskyella ouciana]